MKEKVDPKLIENYTRGQYSFRDLMKIAYWFEHLRYHAEIKSAIESHWYEFEAGQTENQKDLSTVFNVLKEKILAEKNQLSAAEKIYKLYARVAAILLLPLLVYSVYSIGGRFFTHSELSWIEVVSPEGTRTHFELPDGSKVSLNGGASLQYVAGFNKNRQVKLDGEAYFDVAHQASSPFVVQTDVLDVKVLGTKFSVASLKNENSVEVILEEGKVRLEGKERSFSEVLKPNEGFFYDREARSGKIAPVDAPSLTAWKDGLLIFRSEPLGEVLKRIGRWYNVQFDIQDKQIEGFSYRATFQNEPLEEVLRLIALTAPIEYEIKDRRLNADGIYEKKVIVVNLRK
jgi:ferric-dicitrate binding protein FerR (iron transport regulator)